MTTSEEREENANAKASERTARVAEISFLKGKGYTNATIAVKLKIAESTVARLLEPKQEN